MGFTVPWSGFPGGEEAHWNLPIRAGRIVNIVHFLLILLLPSKQGKFTHLDKAVERERETKMLFCKGALELGASLCRHVPCGAAAEQSNATQSLSSTAVWGLLNPKPLGTAFSSAYFLNKLNCNCGLQMESITYICLPTFITICWFQLQGCGWAASRKDVFLL